MPLKRGELQKVALHGFTNDGSPIELAITPEGVLAKGKSEIKYAKIAVGASGDNVLVAAVTGRTICVISLFLIAAGDVDAYFVDGADTDLVGDGTYKIDLTANSGFVLPFNEGGWFETGVGQTLDINLSGAVNVAGALSYTEG